MKKKLPAILFLISTGFSVVVYQKVVEYSGQELLGVFAAIGFYMMVFAVLCVLFNTKETEGNVKSTWQELKELQESVKKSSQAQEASDKTDSSLNSEKKKLD